VEVIPKASVQDNTILAAKVVLFIWDLSCIHA
jgi:hypothetical protein